MATVCRLRALAALQNFARIQHFRSIASRSAAITVVQKSNTTTNRQSYILQRVSEVSAPVRQYGSVPEMTMDSIKDRCILVLKLFDKVDPEKVTLDARFIEDLGLDSLDVVEIVMAFEDEFGIEIPDETAERLKHVKDVVECLADKMDVAQ